MEMMGKVRRMKLREQLSNSEIARRQWLYAWLLNPNIPGNYQKSVDKWIAILIVANLFAMVLELVPAIFEPYKNWFHAFDVFSITVFVIEYLTRFYLAPEDEEFKEKGNPRLAYMASPFAIIDLLAILPYLLQAFVPVDLRALRFLRLLRILKIFRILLEHYKYLLNQIAQLGIYVDQKAFLDKAKSEDRLTTSEVEIWKHILEHR